jgi:hypothetical protein
LNLIVIMALVLLGVATAVFLRTRKANRVSHERDGLTHFRDTYGNRYPDVLLQETYAYLAWRDATNGPHYLVQPADNLQQVYGLADLDLEDAVLVIADKVAVRLPSVHDLDALKLNVRTVDDMLRYLEPYFRSEPVKG